MMNSLLVPALPSQRSEELEKLELHVQCRLNGRVRDLRILSRDDGLVIKGWTTTYYAKQLAQQAVMEATPTPIVANEIEVA
jgi:hypothetical protein